MNHGLQARKGPINQVQTTIKSGTEHGLASGSQVVLYNDDIHTTAHVAHALMMVCGHPMEIAMQIMMEAHEQGRSIAYFGSYNTCLQMKNKLQTLGLTVELERVS